MQISIPDSIYKDYLVLGIQTNIGQVDRDIEFKCKAWAPGNAKSYTVQEVRHLDYKGNRVDEETGYARIEVKYYTTQKEGANLCA